MTTERCDTCGQNYTIGDWPFCPHGKADMSIETDERWIGGKTFENLGPQPITFHSRSEHRRYLREHGITEFVRHQPLPGTDKSKYTQRWI